VCALSAVQVPTLAGWNNLWAPRLSGVDRLGADPEIPRDGDRPPAG